MTARYSYHWPRTSNQMLKDLEFQCPVCGEGNWTVTLDLDGNEVGSANIGCSASGRCGLAYVNGQYGDELAAAIAAADKAEANGPTDAELERYYDLGGGESPSYLNAMRGSGRMQ